MKHVGDGCWDIPMGELPLHQNPKITEFVKLMFKWSERHNLNDSWCREHAFETIDLWLHNQDFLKSKIWWVGANQALYGVPIHYIRFVKSEFLFNYFTLYPSEGFRQDVIDEISKEFKEQLNNFLNERDAEAKKEGMSKIPRQNELDHFKWLAMYQCLPESLGAIAKKVHRASKTVEDGVKKVAELINLTLRKPLPAGAKRKI